MPKAWSSTLHCIIEHMVAILMSSCTTSLPRCAFCTYSNPFSWQVKRHVVKRHGIETTFLCVACKRFFPNSIELDSHRCEASNNSSNLVVNNQQLNVASGSTSSSAASTTRATVARLLAASNAAMGAPVDGSRYKMELQRPHDGEATASTSLVSSRFEEILII